MGDEDLAKALEALRLASEPSEQPLRIEQWPDVVAVLEKWAEGRKQGILVSTRIITQIIKEHLGKPVNEHNIRAWIDRHHPGLTSRGNRRSS